MKCKIAMEIEVTVEIPDSALKALAPEVAEGALEDNGGFLASVAARRALEDVFGNAEYEVEDYIEFEYFDDQGHVIEDIFKEVARILGWE